MRIQRGSWLARTLINISIGLAGGLCAITTLPAKSFALGRIQTMGSTTAVKANQAGNKSTLAPAQIQRYLAVYRAMRHDRSLTVEQAATRQGLTLKQFRELELRIERSPSARKLVRDTIEADMAPRPKDGRPSRAAH